MPEAGLEPAWTFARAILSRLRLPFRHSGVKQKGKHIRLPRGAEDEIRTRDLLLGKETRYRCATSAFLLVEKYTSIAVGCQDFARSQRLTRREHTIGHVSRQGLLFWTPSNDCE